MDNLNYPLEILEMIFKKTEMDLSLKILSKYYNQLYYSYSNSYFTNLLTRKYVLEICLLNKKIYLTFSQLRPAIKCAELIYANNENIFLIPDDFKWSISRCNHDYTKLMTAEHEKPGLWPNAREIRALEEFFRTI